MRSAFLFKIGLCAILVGRAPNMTFADDARWAPPFTPAWAAPQLDVYPPGGPPGSHVTITGSKFRGHVGVFFGDQPMPIVARGERELVVVIPRYARGSDFIYVVDSIGRARTVYPFELVPTRRYGRYYHEHRGWPPYRW